MSKISPVILEDIEQIAAELKGMLKPIEGSTWLVSGGAGFLGSYFLDLLRYINQNLLSSPCRVLCIDSFVSGIPDRIRYLNNDPHFEIIHGNIVKPLEVHGNVDYIVHLASIASPTFYRMYPIETIEANVWGLKNLLDLARSHETRSFLYFSTSEIYGDPDDRYIPTPETYNGNVSCTGPRACYDESKRLGETLAVNYFRQYRMPVKTIRPFNVYGPGLRLEDKRVIPDFFRDALYTGKISILSNGQPTRSFCYVRDAIIGFMKVLLSDFNGDAFNIGNDEREISMLHLAQLIAHITGGVTVEYGKSHEQDYLKDNPQRRCPDLTKARSLLGYEPKVSLTEGLERTLRWYRETYDLKGGTP